MSAHPFRQILTAIATLLLGVATPVKAINYQWSEGSAPYYEMAESQRDILAAGDDGRVYLLAGDGHSGNYLAIREANGAWGGAVPISIPTSFRLNEFVTNPNTGRPIALGTEAGPIGVPAGGLTYSWVVGYEYNGSDWDKTVYATTGTGDESAFDFDESGVLHLLYWDRDSLTLHYGRHAAGATELRPMTSLLGSTYTQLEIQASSLGDQPIFVSVYDPDGWVFATISTDSGISWDFPHVITYGFTATSYGMQQFASELDDMQRLHLFYVAADGMFLFVRHRIFELDGSVTPAVDLRFGSYGWGVLMHNGEPHYVHTEYDHGHGGYVLNIEHFSFAGWEGSTPVLGRHYQRTDGAVAVGNQLLVIGVKNSGDKELFIGVDQDRLPALFRNGFE